MEEPTQHRIAEHLRGLLYVWPLGIIGPLFLGFGVGVALHAVLTDPIATTAAVICTMAGLLGSVAATMGIAFKWVAPPLHGRPLRHPLIRVQTINCALSAILVFGQAILWDVLPRSVAWLVNAFAIVALVIAWLRPLLGYGELGRELTRAVKEDERRSWRS